MGQWLAAKLQQLDQRASQWVVLDRKHGFVALASDPAMLFQLPEVVKKSCARAVELGGEKVERNGAANKGPNDADAAVVGQAGGDGACFAVAVRGASGQDFANGPEKGCGRRDLGVGLHAVYERNALTFGLQEAAGLDAPQFLAGVRTQDADGFAELGDVEAGRAV